MTQQERTNLLAPIFDAVEIIVPTTVLAVIERCPGDKRDLLGMKTYQGVTIVTTRRFIEEIDAQ